MNLMTIQEPSASVNFLGDRCVPCRDIPSEVRISCCPGALVHPEQMHDA